MEEVGGLDKSGNADFEKLYDHEFMVGIYYNDFGQLITDKIYTILSKHILYYYPVFFFH